MLLTWPLPLSLLFLLETMQVELTQRLARGSNPFVLPTDGLITKCEAFLSMQIMPKISRWDCAWPDKLDLTTSDGPKSFNAVER